MWPFLQSAITFWGKEWDSTNQRTKRLHPLPACILVYNHTPGKCKQGQTRRQSIPDSEKRRRDISFSETGEYIKRKSCEESEHVVSCQSPSQPFLSRHETLLEQRWATRQKRLRGRLISCRWRWKIKVMVNIYWMKLSIWRIKQITGRVPTASVDPHEIYLILQITRKTDSIIVFFFAI